MTAHFKASNGPFVPTWPLFAGEMAHLKDHVSICHTQGPFLGAEMGYPFAADRPIFKYRSCHIGLGPYAVGLIAAFMAHGLSDLGLD